MRYILITIFCINSFCSYSQVRNYSDQIKEDNKNEINTSRKVSAYILSGIGGALIGIPVGQESGGRTEANWFLAGAGVAFITSAFPVLFGDDINVSVKAVRGSYKMGRMKSLLPGGFSKYDYLNLPYENIDSYPSSTGYEMMFSGTINKWLIGTKVTMRSALGQFDYNNQNEVVQFRDKLRVWEITELVGYNFIFNNKIRTAILINVGLGETTEKRSADAFLNAETLDLFEKTKYLNIFFGPELSVNYFLSDNIYLNALIGYDHHIVKRHMYTYGAGIDKEVDWSGMRYGIGFGIKLSRK